MPNNKPSSSKKVALPDFQDGSELKLTINDAYGRSFEEKERRRELAYIESQGIGSDSESDDSDDSEV